MSEQENIEAAAAADELQQAAKKQKKRSRILFGPLVWITVIVPTLVSLVYFGVIAADRYTSESSFVVRTPRNQAALSGLGAVLQNIGFSRSQDDTYTVRDYMHSRTALEELSAKMPIRSFFEEKGDIFRRFNGFGFYDSEEAFYQYYKEQVSIQADAVSGITTLSVSSFDAADSQKINAHLLKQGETLINRLNMRARKDTIRYAQEALNAAQKRVKDSAEALTEYRRTYGVFDLKAQSEVQIGLVSKLQDELILIQTQLAQVQAITPENPQIPGLQAREKSLRKEITQQLSLISGRGGNSLAGQTAEYQSLMLENDLAEKQLAAAVTALESAEAEADRQQLYLEVVERPSKPDMPLHPKRIYNIIATFIIGLMVYGILSLLAASVREHKN